MASSSKIFISYRRSDAAAYAGRLADSLASRYGRECVFFDIDAIEVGVNFTRTILDAVEACEIMLVIIGRNWLMDRANDGTPRLLDPNDFIRIEIVSALESNKIVVPVLVGAASMPSTHDLPPELKKLAYRNAVELSDDSWNEDLKHLYRALEHNGNLKPQESTGIRSRLNKLMREYSEYQEKKPSPTSSQSPENDKFKKDSSQPPTSPLVFISHADKDRAFVENVVEKLEAAGFDCWVSYRDIPDGQNWAGSIVGAIARSQLMLIVLTPNAVASKHVFREVTVADDENIAFLPFLLDGTTLPNEFKYYLSTGQLLDAGSIERSKALDLLAGAVRKRLRN